MEDMIEKFDRFSYKFLLYFIGMLAITCQLFGWICFVASVGSFIHMDLRGGFIFLLIFILSIFLWRGGNKLYQKLGITETDGRNMEY